jgi:hypothetical protein
LPFSGFHPGLRHRSGQNSTCERGHGERAAKARLMDLRTFSEALTVSQRKVDRSNVYLTRS